MNLSDLIKAIQSPDHVPMGPTGHMEVVFDTIDRSDLLLLSVYYSSGDGKIHIDIGSMEDD